MFKIIIFLAISCLFLSCSVDNKSGFWENKQDPIFDKQLSELNFDESLSFEKFKENVITYGKKSNFPKLDK